jgi:hypothetical protein
MKKILFALSLLLPASGFADTCAKSLIPFFAPGQAKQLCAVFSAGVVGVLANNTYAVARNAANDGNLNIWKADASDNTVLNAKTAKSILFSINGTTDTSLAAGKITFATASQKIVPGATSLLFRDTADAATNLSIVDAGAATFRSTVTSTGLGFPTANEEAVAGAGTTVSDAAALAATKHVHQLTGANGTVGWKCCNVRCWPV